MKYPKMLEFKLVIILFVLTSINSAVATEKATLVYAAEMTEIATDKKGGYPELAFLLKQQRKKAEPTFFLFGGGSLGPSAMSSLDRGTHIIDLLNSLEPNAMGVAKREFSFFEDELSLRSYEAAFPLIASNLVDTLTRENIDGLVENAIVQQGPYKFGVLSVIDESVIEEYALRRVRITNQRAAIEKQSQKLRNQGADLVILLYSNSNPEMAHLLSENIIDISLRRDEHFEFSSESEIKQHPRDVVLSRPGQVAIIQLTWEKGQPQTLQLECQSEDLTTYPKDPQVLRQVINYSDRLSALLQQTIGTLTTPMDTTLMNVRTKENSFANYITDVMKSYTNADVALLNGGTIRGEKQYQKNTILSRRTISKELPFRNEVVLLKVTGKQIFDALENGFSLIEKVKGRFPQVSGMQVVFDSSKAVGERVVSVQINGEALDSKKIYKLATTDYLSVGGDGYSSFKNTEQLKYDNQMSRLVSDIVIDSIKTKKTLSTKIDSRLIDQNNKRPKK